MEYNITDRKFLGIKGLSSVKKSNIQVLDYEIKDGMIEGKINVLIKYLDIEFEEGTYKESLPFSIFCDEGTVLDVFIDNCNLSVIENQGIELDYMLIIKYDDEFKEIKEEIKEDIDQMLTEALKERDESFLDEETDDVNPVKIIDEAEPMEIKFNFCDEYITKKVICYTNLKDVSEKYNVSESSLVLNTFGENMVMITIDE